jgi:YspA, cpYpsA-related SLOG family
MIHYTPNHRITQVKIIITGGRDFTDKEFIFRTLDNIHLKTSISSLIHGDSTGVDKIAEGWAKSRSIPVAAFPADWDKYGKKAGPIRNRIMLDKHMDASMLVAFPGGRGTSDMVKQTSETPIQINKVLYLDGRDHINIYSKGQTDLGRWMSNFTREPIETEDGHFDSIEGYWFWLGTGDESLRSLSGYQAREKGQSNTNVTRIDQNLFQEKIARALALKVLANPQMAKMLEESTLPLRHHYVFGTKILFLEKHAWMVSIWEEIRQILKDTANAVRNR